MKKVTGRPPKSGGCKVIRTIELHIGSVLIVLIWLNDRFEHGTDPSQRSSQARIRGGESSIGSCSQTITNGRLTPFPHFIDRPGILKKKIMRLVFFFNFNEPQLEEFCQKEQNTKTKTEAFKREHCYLASTSFILP